MAVTITDRDRALMLFGPYPVKRVDFDAQVGSVLPDSDEWMQLWAIWEDIYAERHTNFPNEYCDDRLCDKCGHHAMGDDW